MDAKERELADRNQYLREEFYKSYIDFVRYFCKITQGYKFNVNWHHITIAEALMRCMTGECTRLIINIPPRYQKTLLVIYFFIAYTFAHNPRAKFIHLSYSDGLTKLNSQMAREIVTHEKFQELYPMQLDPSSKSTRLWSLIDGGGVYSTAAAGQVTGFGAGEFDPEIDSQVPKEFKAGENMEVVKTPHPIEKFAGAILVDDPLKPDDAVSDVMREAVNERFNSTIKTRTNSRRTPIIVIMQRLHVHDLCGFLEDDSEDDWEVLRIPAIQYDEEGKETALYPAKHTLSELQKMQREDPYHFSAQFMQEPQMRGGSLFKKEYFEIVDSIPDMKMVVRGWDFAGTIPKSTTQKPDWTASMLMGQGVDGKKYILDVSKFQDTPGNVRAKVRNLAIQDYDKWKYKYKIRIPQDPAQAGKDQAEMYAQALSGYNLVIVRPTGSKQIKAEPFSIQCEYGNVKILRGAWNKMCIDNLTAFPSEDDLVDAGADAFNELDLGNMFSSGQTATAY